MVSGPIILPTRHSSRTDYETSAENAGAGGNTDVTNEDIAAGPTGEHLQPSPIYGPSTPGSPAPTKPVLQSGSGRKNISAQIQLGGTNPALAGSALNSPMSPSHQDPLPSSPTVGGAVTSTASPIATIIDQDAEKFRSYLNKTSSPNRGHKMSSAPIQLGIDQTDHATALGHQVAMENIQTQLELQREFLGQVQGKMHDKLWTIVIHVVLMSAKLTNYTTAALLLFGTIRTWWPRTQPCE